ncbi:DUF3558 domain-containing protein [Nocardia puris]|uniref:Uncharacterized protein DUF3558 n=1 Tax=Nocardia puris TaxID=208602 RepID=A0A366DMK4_9NOCA|nr:DUF3558 domain-containing protein [Nocardia puris]RBO90669.1 uncharacterized protein DUF3558 [Nocardia puris]
MEREAGVTMRAVTRAVCILGVVAAGAGLVGCGSTTDGEAQPAGGGTSTSAEDGKNSLGLEPEVPQSFDPCTDIPQSVLDAEDVHPAVIPNTADADAQGGLVKWRGCSWVRTKGHAVSVQVTNMTLDFVRQEFYYDGREATVSGRPTVIARRNENRGTEVCSVNVEMQGGSLEFFVNNPPSREATGTIDACDLGLSFAEKVVPILPVGS